MKVTFVGDGRNDPKQITAFGHVFPLGKEVDVDLSAAVAEELRGNQHFEMEQPEELDREALLSRAAELGISVRGNMKAETLAARIAEAEEAGE